MFSVIVVVRHLTLFVWLHYYNYLLLTATFYVLSHICSTTITTGYFKCVTSYAASLPVALRHTLKNGIELAVYLAFITVFHSYIQGSSTNRTENIVSMVFPFPLLFRADSLTWQRVKLSCLEM
jgi:hypothetical protein